MVFSVFGLTQLFMSCSDDNSTMRSASQTDNLKLISPKGKILASKTDELRDMIIKNSDLKVFKDDIDFESINYAENEKGSLAIISFTVEGATKSMLVPLEIKDGYSIMSDNDNLFIIKNDNSTKQKFNHDHAIYLDDDVKMSQNYASRTAYVCNGGCCGWVNMGNDHYHCGCPAAKLVLTTGGNCQIEVIPD